MEFSYFLDTGFTFKFSPDTDLDEKLTINIDLTVGMPCSSKKILMIKLTKLMTMRIKFSLLFI